MGRPPSFTQCSLPRTSVQVIQYKHRFSLNTPHILFQIVKLHVSSLHMDHHQASYKKSMRKCLFFHTLGLWDLKICRFYICWGVFQNSITEAIVCVSVCVCVCVCVCIFWALSRNCEKWLLASSCLFLRPSEWNTSARNGWIFMKFDIYVFFENMSRKFKFHGNLTRPTGIYMKTYVNL